MSPSFSDAVALVERRRDYEDLQEAQADGMDMPESAKFHETRRKLLGEILEELKALTEEKQT